VAKDGGIGFLPGANGQWIKDQIKNQMLKVKISAIILIGGNYDQKLLAKCLDSLSWADEIIKVETDNLKGSFSDWRNAGAEKAHGDWLFYVDSDEFVTSDLKQEILSVIENCKLKIVNSAFTIPRRNILLGHEMHYGGWWPDYVLRLIKKDSLVKWERELHEQPKIKGKVGKLNSPLFHNSHRTLTEMIDKTNAWSEVEAELLFKSGHPQMVWWRFFTVAGREFWYRGIVKLGFLDGPIGIIEIIYQMYSRMITYAKLWELQLKHEGDNL
jgi:glycosyltransferase involved in cell wall biosynthesis